MNPQVILLAAGKSSRTWPIAEKIFFRFFGKTVLEHQIKTLSSAGLTNICIVGNSDNIERIQTITSSIKNIHFTFAVQKNLNEGQRGGILAAADKINHSKPILIVCSNDIVDKSAFVSLLSSAEKSESSVYLVGKKVDNYFPGGYLRVIKKNLVTHIVEKPKPGNEPSNLVTLLIHLYKNPSILIKELQLQKEKDGYEDCLQNIFDSGVPAEAVEYEDFWQAIKYPWHFLDIGMNFLQNIPKSFIHPSVKISKTAILNGSVYISEGVKIYDYAVINGPVFLGKNTVVANHALVRQSHIGENCVIGHTTEIARSIISDYCWTHQNFVGDSIFDKNVSLGAGTRTGNLRLDEREISSFIKGEKVNSQRIKLGSIIGKNVRIGINTSIMPGVKIGSKNFIGAGLVCQNDIIENQFTYEKSKAVSKQNIYETILRKDF